MVECQVEGAVCDVAPFLPKAPTRPAREQPRSAVMAVMGNEMSKDYVSWVRSKIPSFQRLDADDCNAIRAAAQRDNFANTLPPAELLRMARANKLFDYIWAIELQTWEDVCDAIVRRHCEGRCTEPIDVKANANPHFKRVIRALCKEELSQVQQKWKLQGQTSNTIEQ